MPRGRLLPLAIALTAVLLAACGGDEQVRGTDVTSAPTTSTTKADSTDSTMDHGTDTTDHNMGGTRKVTIVGRNIAFEPDKLAVGVNEEVEVIFDNRDTAVPHNIHFLTPQEIKTDIKNGKSSGEEDKFKLKVDKAGEYEYLCDVHPTMKGELTVK